MLETMVGVCDIQISVTVISHQIVILLRHYQKKSDCYQGHGMTLIQESAVASLGYAKTLPAHKQEEYAKAFQEFNKSFQVRRTKHAEVPTTFVNPIRPKHVKLKRFTLRGLSLRKALEEEEAEKQRQRRAESIEQARLERYNALFQLHNIFNDSDPFSQDSKPSSQQDPSLSDQNLSDGPQFNSNAPVHESENSSSDDDVQCLGTQAQCQSPVVPSSFSQRKSGESDSD